jgi:hypothetical protein
MSHLQKVRVAGQPLRLTRASEGGTLPQHTPRNAGPRPPHRKGPPRPR